MAPRSARGASVPARKAVPLPDTLPGLASIRGARNPRGLATLRQVPREQARVYLAVKRGAIPPETGTRLTYILRELVRTLEAESDPLDSAEVTPPKSSQPSPALRQLLCDLTGRDPVTGEILHDSAAPASARR